MSTEVIGGGTQCYNALLQDATLSSPQAPDTLAVMLVYNSTVKKLGNSAAVILPKELRSIAGMEIGDAVDIDVPRPGVITITAHERPWTLEGLMKGYDGPAPEFMDPGRAAGKELW